MHRILMLEHDDDDRYITKEYFSGNNYNLTVDFVPHSADMWHYLNVNEPPALILLTYQTAPATALPVLQQLKTDSKLKHIPVVVLSGAAHPQMIRECYLAGANSVITKPSSDAETKLKIQAFLSYWFATVALP